ncbi:MAG: zinc ABC transporter substrate-binding protein [bacterium]|jgi:zinc/manganese transport system substrate-binding protein|nr:zinc ABC transporter substrate-binding protein [bacterium]
MAARAPGTALVAALTAALMLTACGRAPGAGTNGKLQVVAAENVWGSIAAQLGGDRVAVTNVIKNPDTDPHDYEPSPADARAVAGAQLVITNGAGYDPWADKLLQASPAGNREHLDVGDLVGVKDGGNPHLWYAPEYVSATIDAITTDLKKADPRDGSYFEGRRTAYTQKALQRYDQLRGEIEQQYSGVSVGATESIFAYLARSLGLQLRTPPGYMNAISEGSEPSAQDKATFDRQIQSAQIQVLVFNQQNSTPDVRALVTQAKAKKISVVPITETPEPANATFQDWQSNQLQHLDEALRAASSG